MRKIACILVVLLGTFVSLGVSTGTQPEGNPKPIPDLAKATLKAARDTYAKILEEEQRAAGPLGELGETHYTWSRRILMAECEVAGDKEARIAAFQAHLDRMSKLEELLRARFEAGRRKAHEVSAAEFFRAEAQLQLAQAKANKLPKP